MLLHAIAMRGRYADIPAPIPGLTGNDTIPPLAALGLPMRSLNAMRAAGIITLADAAEWSLRDLRSLPQVGPAALTLLQEALRAARLDLQPSRRRRL